MEKWYQSINENNDIVISTRIRLARNLKSLPFKEKITKKQQKELNEKVKTALESANLGNNQFQYLNLSDMSDFEQFALVEKHLVSHNFIENPENKLLILSEDQAISIMVNEEDHIRIQVLSSGMDMKNAFETCNRIDDLLDEQLDYAFDESLGYLTVCPTNLGTGLRASVMLHLPALERTQAISQLIKTVGRLGLTIRGSYGEGTRVIGSTYQLSNQVTLGLSEETAIQNLQNIAAQIIEAEKATRKELLKNNLDILDEICRSYGILKYARLLSSNEFYEHISNVRLGVSEGVLTDVTMAHINELYNLVGTATICALDKKRYSQKERDMNRAQKVRELL